MYKATIEVDQLVDVDLPKQSVELQLNANWCQLELQWTKMT